MNPHESQTGQVSFQGYCSLLIGELSEATHHAGTDEARHNLLVWKRNLGHNDKKVQCKFIPIDLSPLGFYIYSSLVLQTFKFLVSFCWMSCVIYDGTTFLNKLNAYGLIYRSVMQLLYEWYIDI